MSRRPLRWLIVPCLLLAGAGLARSQVQVKLGEPAPDFPTGAFADGKSYSIDELKGRLVVLYFFDGTSPFSRRRSPSATPSSRPCRASRSSSSASWPMPP